MLPIQKNACIVDMITICFFLYVTLVNMQLLWTIQSPIAQYSRSEFDKAYADSRESLFGHLIVERGRSVKTALEELRPNVKRSRSEERRVGKEC